MKESIIKNGYLYVLSIAFILKLMVESVLGPALLVSVGILYFYIVSSVVIYFIVTKSKKAEILAPPDIEISSASDPSYLDNVLLAHNLEMKIKRVDNNWQVILTAHYNGIIKIVGKGEGDTIMNAAIKAEVDFFEKESDL